MNTEIVLNQFEEAAVLSLPVEMQATARTAMLNKKIQRAADVKAARETFGVSLSETVKDKKGKTAPGKGGYKVTGLGSRYPVTLYPEQWEIIFANIEVIRGCYNDPANKAKSEALRRA